MRAGFGHSVFTVRRNVALTMRNRAFGRAFPRYVMFFTPEQAFRKLSRIEM
jgi:hypothetical protein